LDVQDFEPGEDLRKRIMDEMRSASKVVIIATTNSANSEWVNYEAGMAAALEKPIVILRKGIGKTASFIRSLGTDVQSVEIG
jgi:nucleoside 2-deoxyribosyltransferase